MLKPPHLADSRHPFSNTPQKHNLKMSKHLKDTIHSFWGTSVALSIGSSCLFAEHWWWLWSIQTRTGINYHDHFLILYHRLFHFKSVQFLWDQDQSRLSHLLDDKDNGNTWSLLHWLSHNRALNWRYNFAALLCFNFAANWISQGPPPPCIEHFADLSWSFVIDQYAFMAKY